MRFEGTGVGTGRGTARDVLRVRYMLNATRHQWGGSHALNSTENDDGELMCAIESFQLWASIATTRKIEQDDATYKALHRALGESPADDKAWETGNVETIRTHVRAVQLIEREGDRRGQPGLISAHTVSLIVEVAEKGAGFTDFLRRIAVVGANGARQLYALALVLTRLSRAGYSFSQLTTFVWHLFKLQGIGEFLKLGDKMGIAKVGSWLGKLGKAIGVVALAALLVKVIMLVKKGSYGEAFGEITRTVIGLIVWPIGLLDFIQSFFEMICPSLVNNYVWRLLTTLNPGPNLKIIGDCLMVMGHALFLSIQHENATLNAVLNDLAQRIENSGLGYLSDLGRKCGIGEVLMWIKNEVMAAWSAITSGNVPQYLERVLDRLFAMYEAWVTPSTVSAVPLDRDGLVLA